MKKVARIIIKIFVICSLLTGIVSLEAVSLKVVKTASDLFVLRDNARFYDEQPVKTDEMTQDYLANQKERQKLYNSDDTVVRLYSNTNPIAKIVFFVIAIVFIVCVPLSALYLLFIALMERRKAKYKRAQLRRKVCR